MFALLETLMNGSVTMKTAVSIVDIDDFTRAKSKVKHILFNDKYTGRIKYVVDDEDMLAYTMENEPLFLVGVIQNKPVNIIKD